MVDRYGKIAKVLYIGSLYIGFHSYGILVYIRICFGSIRIFRTKSADFARKP